MGHQAPGEERSTLDSGGTVIIPPLSDRYGTESERM